MHLSQYENYPGQGRRGYCFQFAQLHTIIFGNFGNLFRENELNQECLIEYRLIVQLIAHRYLMMQSENYQGKNSTASYVEYRTLNTAYKPPYSASIKWKQWN